MNEKVFKSVFSEKSMNNCLQDNIINQIMIQLNQHF